MISVASETREVLKAGRLRCLVFFDFMFTPMRVHDGDGPIEWDGQVWMGAGAIIRTNLSLSTTRISSAIGGHGGYHRGEVRASLPTDATTREVFFNGYHRDRRMEVSLCSLDAQGQIIERVFYATGVITETREKGNLVTVIAKDDGLDSVEEKDVRRAMTTEHVRARFRERLSHVATSSVKKLPDAIVGNWIGVFLDALALFRRSNWRAIAQRWQARKRKYWVTTEPSIPYKWKRRKGYAFRADTQAEAQQALFDEVARKVWKVPRGWLKMFVRVDGRWVGSIDLDQLRRESDPERWAATDPLRKWGRKE